ncbi:hypothetical protein ACWC3X_36485 [Streptomyces populi]
MLILGEMALQVDMPELVHRSNLPQHTATFMGILEKRHKIPREATAHRQVGTGHGEIPPCCLGKPAPEPDSEPDRHPGCNPVFKPRRQPDRQPGREPSRGPGHQHSYQERAASQGKQRGWP